MANILTSLLYYEDEEQKKFWEKMTDLCITTYKEHLRGDWEYRQVEVDKFEHHDEAFYKNFLTLYKWWQEGHNVFYTNVDIICVKDITVFDKYKELTMWWQTDPPSKVGFKINFNCALMYIPKETTQEVWDKGIEEYKKYFSSPRVEWAADQDIFNHMLYAQGGEPERFLDNTMHYLDKTPELNEIKKEEAKLLHYFSTRGKEEAFKNMKEDYDRVHRTG